MGGPAAPVPCSLPWLVPHALRVQGTVGKLLGVNCIVDIQQRGKRGRKPGLVSSLIQALRSWLPPCPWPLAAPVVTPHSGWRPPWFSLCVDRRPYPHAGRPPGAMMPFQVPHSSVLHTRPPVEPPPVFQAPCSTHVGLCFPVFTGIGPHFPRRVIEAVASFLIKERRTPFGAWSP